MSARTAEEVIADAIRIEAERDLIAAYDAENVTARILSALAAARYVVERDWCHDMAKAPRDGTPIQVLTKARRPIRRIMTTAWHQPTANRHGDRYGWDFEGNGWIDPIAWRPLPAPPAAKENEG